MTRIVILPAPAKWSNWVLVARGKLKSSYLDRMNATELAANQFRITQTRDKLARENINNQQRAIQAHQEVGKEVRAAIERIGGTPPEQIAPAEHIKGVEKRLKSATPKM